MTSAKNPWTWLQRLRNSKYYPLLLIVLIILLLFFLLWRCLRPLVPSLAATGSTEPVLTARLVTESAQPAISQAPDTLAIQDDIDQPPKSMLTLKRLAAVRQETLDQQSQSGPATRFPRPVAVVRQPDPDSARVFLLVSESEVAAQAFNSYFSFYFDWTEAIQPSLIKTLPVLLIDRLFPEHERSRALADQSYSSPELVAELTYWLEQLVDPVQGAEISQFVLDNYHKDFARRSQPGPEFAPWQNSAQLGPVEVTYYADTESYCTFVQA